MDTKLYEASLMEFLSVEVTSSLATFEYVTTPSGGGLEDRVNVDVENWD